MLYTGYFPRYEAIYAPGLKNIKLIQKKVLTEKEIADIITNVAESERQKAQSEAKKMGV